MNPRSVQIGSDLSKHCIGVAVGLVLVLLGGSACATSQAGLPAAQPGQSGNIESTVVLPEPSISLRESVAPASMSTTLPIISSQYPTDKPVDKKAARELAEAVSKFLTTESKAPNNLRNDLQNGVVGLYGSPDTGYTMLLGSEKAPDDLPDFVAELSAEARSLLTVKTTSISAVELLNAWEAVTSLGWCPDPSIQSPVAQPSKTSAIVGGARQGPAMSVILDPQFGQIVVHIDPDYCQPGQPALRNIAPHLVTVQIDQ
ncbi:MAG: hypothetical protein LBG70_04315 [Bifidobacteriaceae bacterium]|jgi:hypothetical protein|nr:hypothetical protein [Bifidobacteriaceae bacterium]